MPLYLSPFERRMHSSPRRVYGKEIWREIEIISNRLFPRKKERKKERLNSTRDPLVPTFSREKDSRCALKTRLKRKGVSREVSPLWNKKEKKIGERRSQGTAPDSLGALSLRDEIIFARNEATVISRFLIPSSPSSSRLPARTTTRISLSRRPRNPFLGRDN